MSDTTVKFDILAIDRASSKFSRIGTSAQTAGGGVGSLGGKLRSFAKAGALAAVAAGTLAVKFGVDTIKAASDLNETMNKTTVVFGKAADGVVNWSKKSATALGLSQQQALAFTSQFGDMFHQLGQGQGQAAKTSKGIVKLATDLGSFHNLGTDEVLDKIAGAMRGEYDAIQKIIPGLSDARVKQEALRQSGKTSTDQLTEQEKAMAALAIITSDGAAAANDFAETSGGLANQQKILAANFDNVKASIGQKLLPVAVMFVSWINETIPKIGALKSWLGDKLGPAFAAVGAWVSRDLMPALRDLAADVLPLLQKHMGAAKDAFSDAKPYFKLLGEVVTNVIIPGLGKLAQVAIPLISLALRGLGKAFGVVGKWGKWLWNEALQPAFKFITLGIAGLMDGWSAFLSALGHIPGFDWATKAADKMAAAADEARGLAADINQIPEHKRTDYDFHTNYTYSGLPSPTRGRSDELGAPAGRTSTGGSARRRPVFTPAGRVAAGGASYDPVLLATLRELFDGLGIVVTGLDPAAEAHLTTGALA